MSLVHVGRLIEVDLGVVVIQDAAWMLPAGSPMKCMAPSDVYMLLKSSDFILHDLDAAQVFEGCDSAVAQPKYELELVLRKWYPVDRSRELRCFVRRERLLGTLLAQIYQRKVR